MKTLHLHADAPRDAHPQTSAEEAANVATHGVGLVLAVAALTLLVVRSSLDGDAWRIITLSIFGATLTAMYLVSTLYHAVRAPKIKRALRVADHAVIFVFIAGSYTPFMLVTLGGAWGWSIFGVVWALAAAGVLYKVFATGRHPVLSTALYLGMGWILLIPVSEVVREMSTIGLVLLGLGGGAYTLGVIFYRLDRIRFNHAVWHTFVMAGSACHVMAMWTDVVPLV